MLLVSSFFMVKDTEKKEREKGSARTVPVVKNHLDIAETALRELDQQSPDLAQLLRELVSRGVLFSLQTSRSRQGYQTTRRLMVRRILLTRHTTALGRDQAICIDDVQRLVYFLTEPSEFVKKELDRTSATRTAKPDPQRVFFPEEPEDENADA